MPFTRFDNAHWLIPVSMLRFIDRPARVKTAALNLIGLMHASSFDAPMHTVNALTEELFHLRFSVHAASDRAGIDAQNIGAILPLGTVANRRRRLDETLPA
jgi:hypothetical protein